jgi:hypothetical protein
MKSSKTPTTDRTEDPAAVANLGSEYMDARSYLTQPVRAQLVKESDETFHGSNDSDYGIAVERKG